MSYLDSIYSEINAPSMPQPSQLGYSTNNVYENFPPLMSDGRTILASHQPESATNQYLLEKLGINSNWQYRYYLQNNAKDIMKYNCMNMANDVGYINRFDKGSQGPNVPQTFTSMSDSSRNSSDLMDLYLSRNQLDERRNVINPVSQYKLL